MNVAGPVRASRPIDGGNNYGKLPRSSHGGGDTAAGGVNMYLEADPCVPDRPAQRDIGQAGRDRFRAWMGV